MARKKKAEQVSTSVVVAPITDLPAPQNNAPAPVVPVSKKVFKYERISASMLKTWLTCKRKFFHQYVEGIKSPSTDSFSLGTAVHAGLEAANRSLKGSPRELNPFEIEQFVQVFRDTLAKSTASSMDQFQVGEELVRTELCTSDWSEQIVGIEMEFDQVTPEGVRIYGFIDKIIEVDRNTVKVTDYKTSRTPLSYEEARVDEQLAMYDLALSLIFPQYSTVLLELKYLRTGDSVIVTKTPIERHNFRRQILAIDGAIKNYLNTIALDVAPDGNLNDFCSWCTYKSSCNKYTELVSKTLPDFPQLANIDDNNFIEMWDKVSGITKAADSWKDQLKLWVAARLESSPDSPVSDGKKEVYTMSTTRREYDPVLVGQVVGLQDLLGASTGGVPLIKINNKAIESYLKAKKNRSLEAKIEQAADVKFNSFQIRTRKV